MFIGLISRFLEKKEVWGRTDGRQDLPMMMYYVIRIVEPHQDRHDDCPPQYSKNKRIIAYVND